MSATRRVDVQVDSHLRVDGNVLGHDLVNDILDLLTIENEEKIDKSYRNTYGWWDLPDDFLLANLDGDTLVMPRGFALSLKQFLRERGIRVHWIDRTKWARGIPFEMAEGFKPRRHQPAAIRQIRRHRQGIYIAPTGSGKTVSLIKATQELCPENALILVNQIDLVDQWIGSYVRNTTLDRDEMGRIGDGTWTEGQITIATVQSIWAEIDSLIEDNWFDKWDFVYLDECHHVTAYTINDIMDRFTARYRGGTSATPFKTGNFMLATTVLGDVIHEDDYEKLKEDNILLAPEVEIVETDFKMAFWGDHEVVRDKKGNVDECDVPGCPKSGKVPHRHRNNYAKVLSSLVRDNARNHRVADKVEQHIGRVQLIVSNQTTQLDEIEKILGSTLYDIPQDQIYSLTGRTKKGATRRELVEHIKTLDQAVILSTVAGEGLDIPTIDVIHMPFPTKNGDKVRQIIGRAMRVSEGKTHCLILDYADKKMSVFRTQLSSRVRGCYMQLNLSISGYQPRAEADVDKPKGLGRL
jgi:superfamily II DNA or RNA helicase